VENNAQQNMFYILESSMGGEVADGKRVGAEWSMLSAQGHIVLFFEAR